MIIKDENVAWASWKFRKIETLVKSKEGKVHGAHVRTPSCIILVRPVNKLIPIESVINEQTYNPNTQIKSGFNQHLLSNSWPHRQAAILKERKFEDFLWKYMSWLIYSLTFIDSFIIWKQ